MQAVAIPDQMTTHAAATAPRHHGSLTRSEHNAITGADWTSQFRRRIEYIDRHQSEEDWLGEMELLNQPVAWACRGLRQQLSAKQITAMLRCSPATAYRTIKRAREVLAAHDAVAAIDRRRLTDEERLEKLGPDAVTAYSLTAAGWTQEAIGEFLDVSERTVRRLLSQAREAMADRPVLQPWRWESEDATDVPTEVIRERVRRKEAAEQADIRDEYVIGAA